MMIKGYLRGLFFALIWFALLFAALYAAAWWAAEPPHMGKFCLLALAAWPPCAGFCAGWREGKGGFTAGLRSVLAPLLLMAAAWWWLAPALWEGWLAVRGSLFALAASTLMGGLGAGFKKARLLLQPPSADEDEENIE